MNDYQRNYNLINAVQIAEKKRLYRQEHKEHINEYKNKYYYDNRDKYLQKVNCLCGSNYCISSKSNHLKTIKHRQLVSLVRRLFIKWKLI